MKRFFSILFILVSIQSNTLCMKRHIERSIRNTSSKKTKSPQEIDIYDPWYATSMKTDDCYDDITSKKLEKQFKQYQKRLKNKGLPSSKKPLE